MNEVNLDGNDEDVASWIWHNLVPKSGQAATVQGELLRCVEKLAWETQRNGTGNWDACFVMLIDFLATTLDNESRLSSEMRRQVAQDCDRLRDYMSPYTDDDLYDRLRSAVVAYCRLNRVLEPKSYDPGQYR